MGGILYVHAVWSSNENRRLKFDFPQVSFRISRRAIRTAVATRALSRGSPQAQSMSSPSSLSARPTLDKQFCLLDEEGACLRTCPEASLSWRSSLVELMLFT